VHWVGVLKGLCYDARSEKHQIMFTKLVLETTAEGFILDI